VAAAAVVSFNAMASSQVALKKNCNNKRTMAAYCWLAAGCCCCCCCCCFRLGPIIPDYNLEPTMRFLPQARYSSTTNKKRHSNHINIAFSHLRTVEKKTCTTMLNQCLLASSDGIDLEHSVRASGLVLLLLLLLLLLLHQSKLSGSNHVSMSSLAIIINQSSIIHSKLLPQQQLSIQPYHSFLLLFDHQKVRPAVPSPAVESLAVRVPVVVAAASAASAVKLVALLLLLLQLLLLQPLETVTAQPLSLLGGDHQSSSSSTATSLVATICANAKQKRHGF
jgi:hypothetical protein